MPTVSTLIALAFRLGFIPPPLRHLLRGAVWTGHAVRPAQLAHGFITLRGVDQVLYLQHPASMPRWDCKLKPPSPRFRPTSLESLLSHKQFVWGSGRWLSVPYGRSTT